MEGASLQEFSTSDSSVVERLRELLHDGTDALDVSEWSRPTSLVVVGISRPGRDQLVDDGMRGPRHADANTTASSHVWLARSASSCNGSQARLTSMGVPDAACVPRNTCRARANCFASGIRATMPCRARTWIDGVDRQPTPQQSHQDEAVGEARRAR